MHLSKQCSPLCHLPPRSLHAQGDVASPPRVSLECVYRGASENLPNIQISWKIEWKTRIYLSIAYPLIRDLDLYERRGSKLFGHPIVKYLRWSLYTTTYMLWEEGTVLCSTSFWCYLSQHHFVIPISNLIGAILVMSNKYI